MDETESIRRAMLASNEPAAHLAATTGPTWTTDQLREEYEVLGFMAPFVVVKRKSDGKKGSLEFTHNPRVYFNWTEDTK